MVEAVIFSAAATVFDDGIGELMETLFVSCKVPHRNKLL